MRKSVSSIPVSIALCRHSDMTSMSSIIALTHLGLRCFTLLFIVLTCITVDSVHGTITFRKCRCSLHGTCTFVVSRPWGRVGIGCTVEKWLWRNLGFYTCFYSTPFVLCGCCICTISCTFVLAIFMYSLSLFCGSQNPFWEHGDGNTTDVMR